MVLKVGSHNAGQVSANYAHTAQASLKNQLRYADTFAVAENGGGNAEEPKGYYDRFVSFLRSLWPFGRSKPVEKVEPVQDAKAIRAAQAAERAAKRKIQAEVRQYKEKVQRYRKSILERVSTTQPLSESELAEVEKIFKKQENLFTQLSVEAQKTVNERVEGELNDRLAQLWLHGERT